MKAYLIDPDALTITEVDHDGGYKDILLKLNCDMIDVVRLDHGDGIYVDDEGLINGNSSGWFGLADAPLGPFKGRGLLLGTGGEGESIAPHMSLEALKALVVFLAPVQVGDEIMFIPLEPTPVE